MKENKTMATSSDCDFCSNPICNLGVQDFVQVTEKYLSDILEEESGVGNKKKKQPQKIGHKLMNYYDKELIKIFNLGEGFQLQKFNHLALDKLRKEKDRDEDLGNDFSTECF